MELKKATVGVPVTQEDFDLIKELLYKGESYSDINKQTGRSNQAIKLIEKSETLEGYKELSAELNRYYRDNRLAREKGIEPLPLPSFMNETTPIVQPQKAPRRYQRVNELRDKLDEFLIEVILDEVSENYADLRRENASLKIEIEKLKTKLETYEKPDFGSKLYNALKSKEVKDNGELHEEGGSSESAPVAKNN